MIGRQRIEIDLNPGSFRRELSRARTFGFMKDVERLWAAGLALGASLENTVAIGDDRIINREGLRYSDEFVRHKALDAVGDLALAGAPILGSYRSRRGGHRLNSLVLKALFADAEAWTLVEAPRPLPRGSPCRAQPPPGGREFRRRAELRAKPPSLTACVSCARRRLLLRAKDAREDYRRRSAVKPAHEQKNTIISGLAAAAARSADSLAAVCTAWKLAQIQGARGKFRVPPGRKAL